MTARGRISGICGLYEDGAAVAEPDAVGGPVVEVGAGQVGAVAAEDGGGAALGGEVVDEDVDVFYAGEVADDFGIHPGDGLEFFGPVFGVVGPGDPGGGVGGPLGGHAVSGGHKWALPLSIPHFSEAKVRQLTAAQL